MLTRTFCSFLIIFCISCQDQQDQSSVNMAGTLQGGVDEVNGGVVSGDEMRSAEPTAGETSADEMNAGETSAGEMNAGETSAGEMNAGETSAGENTAGELSAGEMTAGDPLPPEPSSEHAFFITVPNHTPDWRDLAYLATIPTSAYLNHGRAVVIALDTPVLSPSSSQFINRFSPQQVTVIGAPDLTPNSPQTNYIALTDLNETTIELAASWSHSEYVILASQENYAQAVIASSLAGRLRSPLFFFNGTVSETVLSEIERLNPQSVLVVGERDQLEMANATYLDHIDSVITWLINHDYPLDYVAVINPNDRSAGRSQKLSLTAPLYTSRRDGIVVSVPTEIPADPAHGVTSVTTYLADRYTHLGRHPEYLALVGSFDVIPIERRPSLFNVPERDWPVSDIPYGEVDQDPFREIAVGRIFTNSLHRGSLLAARTTTYELLMDGQWENRFIETGLWGFDELRSIMMNVGFEAPEHLTEEEINNRSTLEVGAILHKDHSHCTVLGNAFTLNTPTFYAPAVVLSRGCSVAGIDLVDLNTNTVPGDMLGRGAVAFIGAPRNSIAGNTVTEVAFFNHLLAGESLGQAMRSGFNNATVHYLDEGSNAAMRYVLDNEMLFGDPALTFHVPSSPITQAAHITQNDGLITVHAPEQWTQVQFVPEQLIEWNYTGDLYMYAGAGAEPKTYWAGQYDHEDLYYTVALTLPEDQPTTVLTELSSFEQPLGWRGGHYIDHHQDASKTVRWRVRLIDYDMPSGVLLDEVQSVSYQLGE